MIYTYTHGLCTLLAGIVLLSGEAECLRGSALVAEIKAKAKAALLNPTETVEEVVTVEEDSSGNSTNVTIPKTKSLLTGNPQIDYIYDPNLPRELNGYNLSSYPFFNGVPKDITFKCDDLHDGFYASVPHKCQVYHHCLFGTRYDFLCANYTAFDQRTFICHFVSEVDCDNSAKFFQRNEALYKSASTSAPIVLQTTTTTIAPPTTAATPRPRRRRPYRRRRPAYEYYYDDQYDDEEYYDDDPPPPRRSMNRKHRPQGGFRSEEDDYYDGRRESSRGESFRGENSRGESRGEGSRGEGSRGDVSRGEGSRGEGIRGEGSRGDGFRGDGGGESSKEVKPTLRVSGPASGTVYDRPRVPPKIRRPVPVHERDKYDYNKNTDGGPSPTQDPKRGGTKKQTKPEEDEDEYYDEEYEDDYIRPLPKKSKTGGDYGSEPSSKTDSRRPISRHRSRPHSRRRPDRYEDDYEEDRPTRPRKRPRYEDPPPMSRGNRGGNRGFSRDEPEPAVRPGFISSGKFSSASRKRTDEDRGSTTTKKPPSRVVYDDELEEEEYYDDEEEEEEEEVVQEDESSRRNRKPSGNSDHNGRRNDDYETETGRKHSGRKQPSETNSPKPTSRSELRSQTSRNYQGESAKSDWKPSNRPKLETTSIASVVTEGPCIKDCDEDYSDETLSSSKQENNKETERGSQKHGNEKDGQKQINERERLFSSRFRDSLNDSKTKQQNNDQTGTVRVSSSHPTYKTTTQNPELPQRHKSSPRLKATTDEALGTQKSLSTTTTTAPSADHFDESSTSSVKYSNFRSKGRVVIPPTPLINNYKSISQTEHTYETAEESERNPNPEPETPNPEEQIDNSPDKTRAFSPRPFGGLARRPAKQTTEPVPYEDLSVSPRTTSMSFNYRQPTILNDEEEQSPKKTATSLQNYRRVKIDTHQVENSDYNKPKITNIGNNFRKPSKPVEEARPEEVPYSEAEQDPQITEDNQRKGNKPFYLDKTQQSNPSFGGAYRRVKVSASSTAAPEIEDSSFTNENPQSFPVAPVSNPVNMYKRPYLMARPLSNNPVVVEDSTKNTLLLNGPLRRPVKQRIQDEEIQSPEENYSPSSAAGDGYRKLEPTFGVNSRPSLGYFPPKRGKIKIDESSARLLEQYPKQLTLNHENQFSKQSPKIEITAPGPSGPDVDIATVKSNYRNDYKEAPGFTLDIPEEEYDVTLNDALQPSTLHPTRSLVDYQPRLKTREYQANTGRSPEYANRGRVSYLLPAASQQYVTRVQSVFSQHHPQGSTTASDNKDQQEYEAVVLSAPGDQYRRNRPTEWYW